MLANVTFSLPDETVKRLRKRAADSGRKKGVVSQIVNEALTRYLDALDAPGESPLFTAFKGGSSIAEAKSLEGLAKALKSKGVDPRSVRVLSSEPLEPVGHLGLRVRTL